MAYYNNNGQGGGGPQGYSGCGNGCGSCGNCGNCGIGMIATFLGLVVLSVASVAITVGVFMGTNASVLNSLRYGPLTEGVALASTILDFLSILVVVLKHFCNCCEKPCEGPIANCWAPWIFAFSSLLGTFATSYLLVYHQPVIFCSWATKVDSSFVCTSTLVWVGLALTAVLEIIIIIFDPEISNPLKSFCPCFSCRWGGGGAGLKGGGDGMDPNMNQIDEMGRPSRRYRASVEDSDSDEGYWAPNARVAFDDDDEKAASERSKSKRREHRDDLEMGRRSRKGKKSRRVRRKR